MMASKLRTGGNDVKSGFATIEMSRIDGGSSRSGIGVDATSTRVPRCTRARSASSSRHVIWTDAQSGSSAIGAPNHTRSPRRNSGAVRLIGPPARMLGSIEIVPAAGARTVSDAMMRSVSATSHAPCRASAARCATSAADGGPLAAHLLLEALHLMLGVRQEQRAASRLRLATRAPSAAMSSRARRRPIAPAPAPLPPPARAGALRSRPCRSPIPPASAPTASARACAAASSSRTARPRRRGDTVAPLATSCRICRSVPDDGAVSTTDRTGRISPRTCR